MKRSSGAVNKNDVSKRPRTSDIEDNDDELFMGISVPHREPPRTQAGTLSSSISIPGRSTSPKREEECQQCQVLEEAAATFTQSQQDDGLSVSQLEDQHGVWAEDFHIDDNWDDVDIPDVQLPPNPDLEVAIKEVATRSMRQANDQSLPWGQFTMTGFNGKTWSITGRDLHQFDEIYLAATKAAGVLDWRFQNHISEIFPGDAPFCVPFDVDMDSETYNELQSVWGTNVRTVIVDVLHQTMIESGFKDRQLSEPLLSIRTDTDRKFHFQYPHAFVGKAKYRELVQAARKNLEADFLAKGGQMSQRVKAGTNKLLAFPRWHEVVDEPTGLRCLGSVKFDKGAACRHREGFPNEPTCDPKAYYVPLIDGVVLDKAHWDLKLFRRSRVREPDLSHLDDQKHFDEVMATISSTPIARFRHGARDGAMHQGPLELPNGAEISSLGQSVLLQLADKERPASWSSAKLLDDTTIMLSSSIDREAQCRYAGKTHRRAAEGRSGTLFVVVFETHGGNVGLRIGCADSSCKPKKGWQIVPAGKDTADAYRAFFFGSPNRLPPEVVPEASVALPSGDAPGAAPDVNSDETPFTLNPKVLDMIRKSSQIQRQLMSKASEVLTVGVGSSFKVRDPSMIADVIRAKTDIKNFRGKKGKFNAFMDVSKSICGLEPVDKDWEPLRDAILFQMKWETTLVQYVQNVNNNLTIVLEQNGDQQDSIDHTLLVEALTSSPAFAALWERMAPTKPLDDGVQSLATWLNSQKNCDFAVVFACLDSARYLALVGDSMPSWYLWDGCSWQSRSRGDIHAWVARMSRNFLSELINVLRGDLDHVDLFKGVLARLRRTVNDFGEASFRARILEGIQSEKTSIRKPMSWVALLESNRNLVAFSDGIVFDIKTCQPRPSEPEDMLQITLPYPFNREAMCDPVAIAELQKFLNEYFCYDHARRDYFLTRCGRALFGIPEQSMYAGLGEGSNGKSTTMDFLKFVLDAYLVKIETRVLLTGAKTSGNEATTGLNALRTARIAYMNEVPEHRKFDLDLFKQILAGDLMRLRELFKESYEAIISVFVIMMCNEFPELPNSTSTSRRVLMDMLEAEFSENQREADTTNHVYPKLGKNQLQKKMERMKYAMLGQLIRFASETWRTGDDEIAVIPPPEQLKQNRDAALRKFDLWDRFREENYTSVGKGHALYKDVINAFQQWCIDRKRGAWFDANAHKHEDQLKRVFNAGKPARKRQDRCGNGNSQHGYAGWKQTSVADRESRGTPTASQQQENPIRSAFSNIAAVKAANVAWPAPNLGPQALADE